MGDLAATHISCFAARSEVSAAHCVAAKRLYLTYP